MPISHKFTFYISNEIYERTIKSSYMHCLDSIMIEKFSSTLRNIKVFDVYIKINIYILISEEYEKFHHRLLLYYDKSHDSYNRTLNINTLYVYKKRPPL